MKESGSLSKSLKIQPDDLISISQSGAHGSVRNGVSPDTVLPYR